MEQWLQRCHRRHLGRQQHIGIFDQWQPGPRWQLCATQWQLPGALRQLQLEFWLGAGQLADRQPDLRYVVGLGHRSEFNRLGELDLGRYLGCAAGEHRPDDCEPCARHRQQRRHSDAASRAQHHVQRECDDRKRQPDRYRQRCGERTGRLPRRRHRKYQHCCGRATQCRRGQCQLVGKWVFQSKRRKCICDERCREVARVVDHTSHRHAWRSGLRLQAIQRELRQRRASADHWQWLSVHGGTHRHRNLDEFGHQDL